MRRHVMALTVAIGVLAGPSAHAATAVGLHTEASTEVSKRGRGAAASTWRGAGLLQAESTRTVRSPATHGGHQGGGSAAEGAESALSVQDRMTQAQWIGACMGAAAGNPFAVPLVPICAGVVPTDAGAGQAAATSAAVVRQIALAGQDRDAGTCRRTPRLRQPGRSRSRRRRGCRR